MMYTLQLSSFVSRRFASTQNIRLASFYSHCTTNGKCGGYRRKIGLWFRLQSVQLIQACTKQFEFLAAQRIRRGMEIFHIYTRIWDEAAFKGFMRSQFMRSWRRRLGRTTHRLLISATGVTMYNWDHERISDEEIKSYNGEIEGIHKLKDATVVCTRCHLRIMFDTIQPGVQYCTCNNVQDSDETMTQEVDGWEPFIERRDMLVWRREESNSNGLFAYKVYGSFSDVTAEDFLQVQIDVNYRKEWDSTARELRIIETDPMSESSTKESTDVIYWEMIWPRLFSNRDYVYQRRWVADEDKGIIVIVSKVTDHPNVPNKPGTYRVTSYWSYMVIRPYKDFQQPGIEFGLTYFDDPGVNVPSAVTTWVAMSGLPDFLIRMRQASINYQNYKHMKGSNSIPTKCITLKKETKILDPEETKEEERRKAGKESVEETEYQAFDDVEVIDEVKSTETIEETSEIEDNVNKRNPTTPPPEEEQGLLHYFYLTRLFA